MDNPIKDIIINESDMETECGDLEIELEEELNDDFSITLSFD